MKKSTMKNGDVLYATVCEIPGGGAEVLIAARDISTLKAGFDRIAILTTVFDPSKAKKIVLTAEPKNTDQPTWENVCRKAESAFSAWWHNEGSGMLPLPGEDAEMHVRRICEIAWANGAYKAAESIENTTQR